MKNNSIFANQFFQVLAAAVLSLSSVAAQPRDSVYEFHQLKHESQPQFSSGSTSYAEFIKANLKYPPDALAAHIEGAVMVAFIIEKDGSMSGLEVLNDLGKGCGAEAKRVLGLAPKWSPGMVNGNPVRVRGKASVRFGEVGGAVPPQFAGSEAGLQQYFDEYFKCTPGSELNERDFDIICIIRKNGTIKKARFGPLTTDNPCQTAAMALLRSMPAWAPAADGFGEPIKSKVVIKFSKKGENPNKFLLPVRFTSFMYVTF